MTASGAPPLQTDAVQAPPPPIRLPVAWLIAIAAFVAFWLYAKPVARAAFDYPKAYTVPLAKWISASMKFGMAMPRRPRKVSP